MSAFRRSTNSAERRQWALSRHRLAGLAMGSGWIVAATGSTMTALSFLAAISPEAPPNAEGGSSIKAHEPSTTRRRPQKRSAPPGSLESTAHGQRKIYSCPEMGCGTYGLSRLAISSALKITLIAAIASSNCAGFVAPMIGAVTPRFRSSQASAI